MTFSTLIGGTARTRAVVAAGAATLAVAATGCGGSSSGNSASAPAKSAGAKAPEASPPGDIPDNQAYVPFAVEGGASTVKIPEGWSRSASGGVVTFTDKLNTIRIESVKASVPPTVRDARQTELPKLRSTVAGYRPGSVSKVTRTAGSAIRMTYLADAEADPVTGKAGTDAVERYVFFHRGRDLVLTLSGPKGADNVDPWRIVTDSVRWTP